MNWITKLRRYRWYLLGRRQIRRDIVRASKTNQVRVILGSSNVMFDGWICTDIPHFDVCKESDWAYFFSQYPCDRLLSEHVFEHLRQEQVSIAVKHAFKYLKPGGVLRIAVPDEWHTNPNYYEFIKVGGTGPGAEDHYSMWNIESMSKMLRQAGFEVIPYEYWTKEGKLVTNPFSDDEGPIRRSVQRQKKIGHIEGYTSLVVDAVKPK